MTSSIFTVALPLVLALVMFGLGLALTVADFARVLTLPKAVLVTLLCQLVLLPALCFGLVLLVGLGPDLAIGMMLLVASPGGVTANILAHLAGGDVAFSITVTAVNSVLAVLTLPLVTAFALARFGDGGGIGLQLDKLAQVFAVVLVPVALGMLVRHRWAAFAERMQRPVRLASVTAVTLAILAAVLQQLDEFLPSLVAVGLVCVVLSVLSLAIGYGVPRLANVPRRQAIASSLEIGVHNAVLAITVAVSVLGNPAAAIAPAIYGVVMFGPAGAFAWALSRRALRVQPASGGR
ncbi:bile acid:sodium symporter family protein [Pseudonocardia ailaonensis]|uniref:Bile acid:sodium symporter family protein n=1 Tax=Pseudonocardia ailaonensis TaxID=367279 RepID=A0ABN2MLR7_9PSEU